MELGSWLMIAVFGGLFVRNLFMLVRDDDRNSRVMTMQTQNLTRRGSPDFSEAHSEFTKKLEQIERHLDSKRRDERAIQLAEERVRKSLADEAAAKLMAEEKSANC